MAEQIDMDLESMAELIGHMHTIDTAVSELAGYLRAEVCNTAGFVGLLEVLVPGLDLAAEKSGELGRAVRRQWGDLADAVRATAHDVDLQDGESSGRFDRVLHRLSPRAGTVAQ